MRSKGWGLDPIGLVCLEEEEIPETGHSKKAAVCNPGLRVSPESKLAKTLILDLKPSEHERMFLLLKSPSLCGILL